ncbi:MAG: hypothetical protein Q8P45_00845 [Candidatus Harrisonbacteria bacterium]|nr:hypothetical protein [Candidatus Harrisonbacteria bacterium]
MKKTIEELEKLAKELRTKDEELSIEVREGGKQTQEGFERMIRAVHRMHNFVVTVPDKLAKMAQELKKQS